MDIQLKNIWLMFVTLCILLYIVYEAELFMIHILTVEPLPNIEIG